MSVLVLPFLGAPVEAQGGDPPKPACQQSGGQVDSFKQRATETGDWQEGNITTGLFEGGYVWEKVELSNLAPGPHEIVLDYTYQWKTAYAFDYLNQLSLTPGTAIDVTLATLSSQESNPNEVVKRTTLTWEQPAGTRTQTIVFAAHLASEDQYGAGNGAASIPGSSFHLTLQTLDCKNIGGRTNQVKVDMPTPPQPELGSLTAKKVDAATDAPIDTATFQLWKDVNGDTTLDNGDTKMGPTKTTSDGIVKWGDLAYGTYLVEETVAPTGYTLPSPAYQAVTVNQPSTTLTFRDTKMPAPVKAKVTVTKVDDATGKAIDTATFQLWKDVNGDTTLDNGDTKMGPTKTTSDGIVKWGDLAYGTYLVEETVAPAGYTLPSPAYQAVTVNQPSTTLTFRDTKKPAPVTGSITVRKHAGTTSGALIDTATFQLWNDVNGNGTLEPAVDTLAGVEKSTSQGTATWTELPYGKYLVQETAAPAGYTLPSPAYQATAVGGAVTLDFVDQPKVVPPPVSPRIDLQVRKHAGTASGTLIDTATFQLWNDVDRNGALDQAVDSKAGAAVSTSGGSYTWHALTPGDYLVEETAAPDGYTLPAPAYQGVGLTAAQAGSTVTLDFVDQPVPVPVQTVNLQVRKHAGSLTGTLIDTATYQLWTDEDGNGRLDHAVDTKVGTAVRTSGGTYTWTDLATGTYLVQETKAPQGYTLPSPRYQAVTLAAADLGTTVRVDFADAEVAGVEVVRPPAAPAAGHAVTGPSYAGVQVLPQTGPRERNELLGLLGVASLALGGALLLSSRRRGAQR